MNQKSFDKLVIEHIWPILKEHGFQRDGENADIFFRKANEDVYHFVGLHRLRSGDRYYAMAYFSSPVIIEDFHKRFPESIPMANANRHYISPEDGVEDYQKMYFCRYEDSFLTSFERDFKPALLKHGLPYLDNIQSVEDMIPFLRSDRFRGPALLYAGRKDEARTCIERQIEKISNIPLDEDGRVASALAFQKGLLGIR
ncbi:hypothetical protein SAMN02745824_0770 [Parasphingorhabdus marina DSM 22363]|uniref:DUF4304 domain-containing protein n=1 Tax=Parasphingorhabdus marina DSM 22363 TaxID=1123272 RepID=A0A1N6CQZ1_9SPHN|nr:hypothetical protein [Parasphingorhabdus marina]SIN60916.1 hypothetical protein SAMN02745824_0770 [Parasphingorhabdus marina DSM 22363]